MGLYLEKSVDKETQIFGSEVNKHSKILIKTSNVMEYIK